MTALSLDFLGFATWAASAEDVVARAPEKFAAYCAWRSRHGVPVGATDGVVEVVEHAVGNEILFAPDRDAARPEEIDLTIRLLACSRADLVARLEAAPEAVLDWDPPYEHFASWADWRTIRANLAHIANGETHYYLRNIGHQPGAPPADPHGDWREFLPRSRSEAIAFLEGLRGYEDLTRLGTVDHGFGEEWWSVRKALRRMVSHELMHAKSIDRIIRVYHQREGASDDS